MTTLLMPLPAEGFDPTETAVPWRRLRDAGIDVVFSTPDGRPGRCDPRTLERAGFWLTFWKLGRHFRTYSEYVESEIRRAIGPEGRFESGPLLPSYDAGFTVRDGNLITARWPGDADALGRRLADLLRSEEPAG